MPEQYKRFGIKVSKIDGISLGACLSIDPYNEEGYLYINLFKWEVCIGWMWFEKSPNKQLEADMMTLEEAIEHCEQKACGNDECSKEHKQLAEWLKELQTLKMNNINSNEVQIG